MLTNFSRTLLVLLTVAVAAPVAAQTAPDLLTTPTRVFVAAASADWFSTAYCTAHAYCVEQNPMFSWAEPLAGTVGVIALGVATDALALWAVRHWIGPRHPRLVRAGLYVAAGLRVSLAVHNTRGGYVVSHPCTQPIPLSCS